MRQKELGRNLEYVITQAREAGIPVPFDICEHVTVNHRPKKRFGCCRRKNGKFTIEISGFITECSDDVIREVLAHEVLHTCPGCHDHGKIWKTYAGIMNTAYGYNIKRTASFEAAGLEQPEEAKRIEEIRYVLRCEKCGREYHRRRRSKAVKNPGRYRCRCGGRLKLVRG